MQYGTKMLDQDIGTGQLTIPETLLILSGDGLGHMVKMSYTECGKLMGSTEIPVQNNERRTKTCITVPFG